MRLDHLLSKREEVGVGLLFNCRRGRRNKNNFPGGKIAAGKEKEYSFPSGKIAAGKEKEYSFPVAMRVGETPVHISNTMVKPYPAWDTALATVWESRWLPDFKKVGVYPAVNRRYKICAVC